MRHSTDIPIPGAAVGWPDTCPDDEALEVDTVSYKFMLYINPQGVNPKEDTLALLPSDDPTSIAGVTDIGWCHRWCESFSGLTGQLMPEIILGSL